MEIPYLKTKIGVAIVFFVCGITAFFSSSMIKPGYVGIKVNAYGQQKGVEDYPVFTGRVWYNPFTTQVFDYPTFTQNMTWDHEEKISFNTKEGSRVACDVALSYMLKSEKVPHIFVKHRQELPYINHNYLRNKVRDIINRHSSEYTAIEVLGTKTQDMLSSARKDLIEALEPEGFLIDTLSFVSAPETSDPKVEESISQIITSAQKSIEAENKVRQIRAEAEQSVAKAEGEARSILTQAEAQAKANTLVSQSITPELVRYKAIEKWDGKSPQVLGSDGTVLFNLSK